MTTQPPRTLSEDEIELYLAGDRRHVDKLILQSINGMTTAFVTHVAKEDPIIAAIGDPEKFTEERAWLRTQIDKQAKRNAMMQKVADSALSWAVIAFLGFIAYSMWDRIVELVQTHETHKVAKP